MTKSYMDQKKQRITVCREATAEIEEKRSVFIGQIAPVSSEDEAREFIARVKKEHYDARHNVFAYVLGGGAISRYTDDGEPKGSAGMPVLNVLTKTGVDGVCVVVTRYFGGILLSTGGLARAYGAAAKAALDAAGLSYMTNYALCEIVCSYSDYPKISPKLSASGFKEEGADFGENVKITVSCKESELEALRDLTVQITLGKSEAVYIRSDERPESV